MSDSESHVVNTTVPISTSTASINTNNNDANHTSSEAGGITTSIVASSDTITNTMTAMTSIPAGTTITTRVSFGNTATGHSTSYFGNTPRRSSCSCGDIGAPSEKTHYRVYLVTYISIGLSHHAICVETGPENRSSWGNLFQVNGNLYEGMVHEFKTCQHPFDSLRGYTMKHIGWVLRQESRVEEVCRRIPAPKKQWDDELKRINPNVPVRHCQHWVVDAITALGDSGVLQPRSSSDDGRVIVRPGPLLVDPVQSVQEPGLQLPAKFA
ncbi:hypothetical protein B0I37DRAFT_898 [Chaetomium sp. MPI-CAGE-AT-0009]|nr:hypothetical protein B0I37DRAFT_898 [Chaetomium sp. MPI-CAGE-AT-0009]